ncbi:MAG: patatin [Gemmatimonadales bacterium]|nr:patatin [Gemmatimonadales bacterium]MBT5697047.1 patatin [Gemmatimonadales bacterium]MBT7694146.1 patatin [Gemmatimonadales bacterium]MDG2241680.1 patatin-like phospholipase family protein [Longimicrobiales bacterium]NCG32770.1 patatin [Pseudomonadota bacterium]
MKTPSTLTALEELETAVHSPGPSDLGLVMGGGGARAAYQVGFLRQVARQFPELTIPYITGVSAGAINAALLASHHGSFIQAVGELSQLWGRLTVEDVFKVDTRSLSMNGLRWLKQLASGGLGGPPRVRGLVDTAPLRRYLTEVLHAVDGELTGIQYNLERGRLKALAISTSSYSTGQSVTWVQGSDIREWERPERKARSTVISVDHIMASSALPLLFPAVQLGEGWYGDGGVRLTAPLSPALHLGARKIMAISTRYDRSATEAEEPTIQGYPPPAQVMGVLMNSIFLDLLDTDAVRLERLNQLLSGLPPERRAGFNPVKLLTLRPSVDLGKLAYEYEPKLPKAFRFFTRGLGTQQTRSPDFLSFVLFQPDYLMKLMEVGETDAAARADDIAEFLRDNE